MELWSIENYEMETVRLPADAHRQVARSFALAPLVSIFLGVRHFVAWRSLDIPTARLNLTLLIASVSATFLYSDTGRQQRRKEDLSA